MGQKPYVKPPEVREPLHESMALMRQIARMANIEWGRFSRMILVLDVSETPRLFLEGYLQVTADEELVQTAITVETGKAPDVKIESMVVDSIDASRTEYERQVAVVREQMAKRRKEKEENAAP